MTGRSERLQIGKVFLIRYQCPGCGEYVLCDPDEVRCRYCDAEKKVKKPPQRLRKIAEPKHKRFFSKAKIREKAEEQGYKCYWCGRPFGLTYMNGNKFYNLHPVGDHSIPYVFCNTTTEDNLVASCNVCNSFKSSIMLNSDDEVREFLQRKWNRRIDRGRILIPREQSDWDIDED